MRYKQLTCSRGKAVDDREHDSASCRLDAQKCEKEDGTCKRRWYDDIEGPKQIREERRTDATRDGRRVHDRQLRKNLHFVTATAIPGRNSQYRTPRLGRHYAKRHTAGGRNLVGLGKHSSRQKMLSSQGKNNPNSAQKVLRVAIHSNPVSQILREAHPKLVHIEAGSVMMLFISGLGASVGFAGRFSVINRLPTTRRPKTRKAEARTPQAKPTEP